MRGAGGSKVFKKGKGVFVVGLVKIILSKKELGFGALWSMSIARKDFEIGESFGEASLGDEGMRVQVMDLKLGLLVESALGKDVEITLESG
jgi:hypothetical protein